MKNVRLYFHILTIVVFNSYTASEKPQQTSNKPQTLKEQQVEAFFKLLEQNLPPTRLTFTLYRLGIAYKYNQILPYQELGKPKLYHTREFIDNVLDEINKSKINNDTKKKEITPKSQSATGVRTFLTIPVEQYKLHGLPAAKENELRYTTLEYYPDLQGKMHIRYGEKLLLLDGESIYLYPQDMLVIQDIFKKKTDPSSIKAVKSSLE